jgi:hypothetical protein
MRLLRLAEAAVETEILLVTAKVQRLARRAALAAVALVFAAGALVCVHVAAVVWLVEAMGLAPACMIAAAVDLVVAGILLAFALRSRPSPEELAARALRRQIRIGLERDLAIVSIITTVLDLLRRHKSASG